MRDIGCPDIAFAIETVQALLAGDFLYNTYSSEPKQRNFSVFFR